MPNQTPEPDDQRLKFGLMLNSLLDIFFPPLCLNCGAYVRSGETVCENCFRAVPLYASLFCGRCRARIPPPAAGSRSRCHPSHPCVLGAAADYGSPAVKNLIHALKFSGVKRAAAPLAELIARYMKDIGFTPAAQIVVPVPLGKNRLRERGYNQAAEIARHVAKHFQLALEEALLIRTKNTKPQTELKSSRERAENVQDCFAAPQPEKVRGRRILLVDDVTTSGATFFAAAKALKAAGARSILALAAAKA